MSISVKNSARTEVEVAINKWGDDGKTGFFSIEPEKSETWSRSDDRGFVMSLQISGTQRPYFVQHNSSIVVHSISHVEDHGIQINPIA